MIRPTGLFPPLAESALSSWLILTFVSFLGLLFINQLDYDSIVYSLQ